MAGPVQMQIILSPIIADIIEWAKQEGHFKNPEEENSFVLGWKIHIVADDISKPCFAPHTDRFEEVLLAWLRRNSHG